MVAIAMYRTTSCNGLWWANTRLFGLGGSLRGADEAYTAAMNQETSGFRSRESSQRSGQLNDNPHHDGYGSKSLGRESDAPMASTIKDSLKHAR